MTDLLTFLAAIPAGIGGRLLGVRGADLINRWLGRDTPGTNDTNSDTTES